MKSDSKQLDLFHSLKDLQIMRNLHTIINNKEKHKKNTNHWSLRLELSYRDDEQSLQQLRNKIK